MDDWNELDAADVGQLFVEKMLDEIDSLRTELYEIQHAIRIEQTLQAKRNKLFGETMLLSVLLLRYIKDENESDLAAAETKLKQLIKESEVFETQCSMSAEVWRELVEACGKMADTRVLKNLSKPSKNAD
ncbi:hypothetical protein [Neisseria zoodegmatis]|uniref:Uncharacterized protein n=1 Tax=Neisseria zoodegmatis TaxID=326523 RepID=A0AB38DSG8_9NEIS|nr:hypothetical protein [Neisseria zoodegmatis]OSI10949.1 hypothetical protein BWD10_03280 [Neisseria zoodegmatis]SNU80184.1 Uncharacterised protein [Neisseria zoodegmatis]